MRVHILIPVCLCSLMLAVVAILAGLDRGRPIIDLLVSLFPIALLWMVYVVIRRDRYSGRELEEEEEWGYADR